MIVALSKLIIDPSKRQAPVLGYGDSKQISESKVISYS
jgi:hypothetical protein